MPSAFTMRLARSAFLVAFVWSDASPAQAAEDAPARRSLYFPGETAQGSTPIAQILDASRPEDQLPPRSFTHVHLDIYELSVSVADLRTAPVQTSIGTVTGRAIGVSGMQTLGVPLVAPHIGVGVEIPHALFYFHGGVVPLLGRATGQVTDQSDAMLLFAQTTAAYRWDLGRFVVARGAELDARARFLTGGRRPNPRGRRSYYQGPPSSSVDLFMHVTLTGIDGASFMIAFGHSFGSLPGR